MSIRSQGSGAERSAYPNRWRALAVTQLAGFMSLLDVSIVNVALPSIQQSLGASVAQVQWVVSGYALTFGLVLVAGGRLGDALGRRRMFLVALTGFVLASALCGAATSAESLVTARLLQGITAGMLTPQNSGLIQVLFHGAERGKAFGVFGATVGLSTAVGPVLGGLILTAAGEQEGWRWVFYVNVPIGLIALVAAWRLVPARQRTGQPLVSQIDVVGALLLGVRRAVPAAPAGAGRQRWGEVAVRAGAGADCAVPSLGANEGAARSGSIAGHSAAVDHPRLPGGSCAGAGVLRRFQRDLAGVRGVLPARSGIYTAAVRAGSDVVRARVGGVGCGSRTVGDEVRPLADGGRVGRCRGRVGRHRCGAVRGTRGIGRVGGGAATARGGC